MCDSNSKCRKFLLQNFTVTDMVTNMLDRRSMGGAPSAGRSCINDRVVALPLNSDFYISTPPCTPFSRRRCAGSNLFDEPAAKPFFETFRTIKITRPKMGLLENTVGLLRPVCLPVVTEQLAELERDGYAIATLKRVDPADYGSVVVRPRVMIAFARCDILPNELQSSTAFTNALKKLLRGCHVDGDRTFIDVLEECCPDSAGPIQMQGQAPDGMLCDPRSPCNVKADCRVHMCRCVVCKKGTKGNCLWRKKHVGWMQKHTKQKEPPCVFDCMARAGVCSLIKSPRVRHVLRLRIPSEFNAKNLHILDTSQAVDFCALRQDGLCPCIATGAQIYVACWGRHLSEVEKGAIMGFDLSQFNLLGITQNNLKHLLGNTIHPFAFGTVMLLESRSQSLIRPVV